MCELHFVNTKYGPTDDASILSALMVVSSADKHKDGFGVFSPLFGVWKSGLPAHNVYGAGKVIADLIEKAPALPNPYSGIMGHTRQASPGIKVEMDNSHPFDGKWAILAHNGRLHKAGETVSYSDWSDDTNESSDSLEFLKKLDAIIEAENKISMPDALANAMKEFTGTFAFLVFDKRDSQYYAIRGSTKLLHVAYVFSDYPTEKKKEPKTKIGYIICTGKTTLHTGSLIAANSIELNGKRIYIHEAEELDKETIYKLTPKGPVKVGDIKETSTPTKAYSYNRSAAVSPEVINRIPTNFFIPATLTTRLGMQIAVGEFAKTYRYTVTDIDTMLYAIFGKGILYISEDELIIFVRRIIPKLSVDKKLRKRMKNFTPVWSTSYIGTEGKPPELKFPWSINDSKTLNKFILDSSKAITED